MAINKLDLGGIKTTKTKTIKTEFPVMVDETGELKEMADEVIRQDQAEKAAKAAKELVQEQIKTLVRPYHFTINHLKPEASRIITVLGSNDAEVQAQFRDAYTKVDDIDPLVTLLGEPVCAQYFEQKFALTVKGDLIPTHKAQEVINDLQAVLARHGVADALSVSAHFAPTNEFASARHKVFTPKQNLAIEEVYGKGLQIISVAPPRGRR